MNMISEMESIRLTQYSHGAGCGCKISPSILSQMLHFTKSVKKYDSLLVGNQECDDAAVLDLGDGTALISTTDFFMPIVDDPENFGKIASVNAISDVYAMGGTPILAIAILGWPVDKLSPQVAGKVLQGSRQVCEDVGIPLAGGHSIDSPEPIFGLAVSGRVKLEHLKKNSGAKPGNKLYLTKPLGVGVLTTAQKQGKLQPEHESIAVESMLRLNSLGQSFGKISGVTAMTDVTGFGLLGHLIEMCEASGVSAEIWTEKVPMLDNSAILNYISKGCIPGGTHRNWSSYSQKVDIPSDDFRFILSDPQTSGGLLVSVAPAAEAEFHQTTFAEGIVLEPIGKIISSSEMVVFVK